MIDLITKAETLIEALPYFQSFRNEIVVVKFGGSVMENPELIKKTMRDLVFMECIGMRPVVVHGGGKAISARLNELEIETHFINGLRYTCKDTLKIVDDVLHNEVNTNLLKGVKAAGGKGQQISGKDIIKASRVTSTCKETGNPIDIGFVGKIEDINSKIILDDINANILPIIPPLGIDEKGQIYNINADVAACKIAEALNARKLFFISDVPGILKDYNDESSIISSIYTDEIPKLITDGIIVGGMIPKITSALIALEGGVNKVHLIDGRLQHSLLLEIFTDEGIGTQIIKRRKEK